MAISSRNSVTHSTYVATVVMSYSTVPSKPTSLTVEPLSHNEIKITWKPVADNGGADVTNFVLNVFEEDTGTKIHTDERFSETSLLLNNGLTRNTKYR